MSRLVWGLTFAQVCLVASVVHAGAQETVSNEGDGQVAISEQAIQLDYIGDDEFVRESAEEPDLATVTLSETDVRPLAAVGMQSREDRVVFSFDAVVSRVSDGDTMRLEASNGASFSIRMSDIDTPEVAQRAFTPRDCRCKTIPYRPGQPGGRRASEALKRLVSVGDDVQAQCYEVGTYGRLVCHVFKGDTNLNLRMVELGWAWLHSRSEWVRDPDSRAAQDAARDAGLGAWGIEGQVSPREWRKACWGRGECDGSPTPQP